MHVCMSTPYTDPYRNRMEWNGTKRNWSPAATSRVPAPSLIRPYRIAIDPAGFITVRRRRCLIGQARKESSVRLRHSNAIIELKDLQSLWGSIHARNVRISFALVVPEHGEIVARVGF